MHEQAADATMHMELARAEKEAEPALHIRERLLRDAVLSLMRDPEAVRDPRHEACEIARKALKVENADLRREIEGLRADLELERTQVATLTDELRAKQATLEAIVADLGRARMDAESAKDALKEALGEVVEAREDTTRLEELGTSLFTYHWDGTIGRPMTWHIAGPWRHFVAHMRGHNFREAIDRATVWAREQREELAKQFNIEEPHAVSPIIAALSRTVGTDEGSEG
jgi:multidrug efflux pump subunit AcrA (membrane-fusion protein)